MNAAAEVLTKLGKLKKDFTYYAPRCLKIVDKKGKVIPFKLNAAQMTVHRAIEEQLIRTGKVRALIVKGRQQGISTYIEGRNFHKVTMNRGLSAYIMTHLQSSTSKIFTMVKNYFEFLPTVLRPATEASNANELKFSKLKSSYGVGTAGSKNTGRGITAQLFHGSECAFWDNFEDVLAAVGQAIPDAPGTEIVFESTANGINRWFFMVQSAIRGIGDYELIFVPWFLEPDYTRDIPEGLLLDPDEVEYLERYQKQGCTAEHVYWRRSKTETDFGGDYTWFDQEYPATIELAFKRTGTESYITLESVENAMARKVEIAGTEPKILGVDVAEYGDDKTVFTRRQGRKAWPQRTFSKKGPMEVAGLVAIEADNWAAESDGEVYINVDCTGVGSGVADRLIEMGYKVNRIHFGAKALEDDIYSKRLDEMHGRAKAWLEDEPNELPQCDILKSDLTNRTYTYDSSRRLVMESKEKMKKRGLASPDHSDSFILTFAVNIKPKVKSSGIKRNNNWKLM